MIYFIKGELLTTEPGAVFVDTGSIAYKLFVSDNTISAFSSKIGSQIRIYTYLSVREDAMDLYGFHSLEEKNTFNMLITVSGVGPKAALAILSILTPSAFAMAVNTGDAKAISKANGVGPKTAARVILELKDKLTKELGNIASDDQFAQIAKTGQDTGKYSDALNALIVLGYSRTEASNALRGLDTSALSLEELITSALKNLMK